MVTCNHWYGLSWICLGHIQDMSLIKADHLSCPAILEHCFNNISSTGPSWLSYVSLLTAGCWSAIKIFQMNLWKIKDITVKITITNAMVQIFNSCIYSKTKIFCDLRLYWYMKMQKKDCDATLLEVFPSLVFLIP